MRTRSIEEMVLDVRRRANLEHSELVEDEEICELLNQELAEIRSHIRRNEGQAHDRSTATITVTAGGGTPAGSGLYSLPADFWELLGVGSLINGTHQRLEPFMENERAGMLDASSINSPMYRLASGTQIQFLPTSVAFSALIQYVKAEPRLLLGQNPPATVEGFNGYEIAAIYGATAACKEKEGTDPSYYAMQKERIIKLIEANAGQRDAASPDRVTDVTGALDAYSIWPFGF